MTGPIINIRLPDTVEQGSQGGPQFLTTIMPLSGGGEKRNIEWQYPRVQWDISYGVSSPDDLNAVKDIFYVTFGRGYGFRFKDWSDYIIGDEDNGAPAAIGTGDGATLIFQIFRSYSVTDIDGMTVYTVQRKITRIVPNTLVVYVDGVEKTVTSDYTVDINTGLITFVSAPASTKVVAVYCEFDIPVRFDTDVMKLNLIWKGAGSIPPINILELRDTST